MCYTTVLRQMYGPVPYVINQYFMFVYVLLHFIVYAGFFMLPLFYPYFVINDNNKDDQSFSFCGNLNFVSYSDSIFWC